MRGFFPLPTSLLTCRCVCVWVGGFNEPTLVDDTKSLLCLQCLKCFYLDLLVVVITRFFRLFVYNFLFCCCLVLPSFCVDVNDLFEFNKLCGNFFFFRFLSSSSIFGTFVVPFVFVWFTNNGNTVFWNNCQRVLCCHYNTKCMWVYVCKCILVLV